MKKSGSLAIAALVALLMAACGGGGGGGAGGGSPTPAPPAPVDPNAPTFQFQLGSRHINAKSGGLVMDAIANGSSVLNLAQFTTDVAHRFAGAGSPASVTANCAYTGQVTLQFDDRDGNHQASAGDVITVTLNNCGLPVFARSLTGSLRVEILATAPSADIDLQARVTVLDSLAIGVLVGGPNVGAIQPVKLTGSLNVQWSETSTGSQLRASSTTADDLHLKATVGGVDYGDALRKIDVSRATHYDSATISSSIAFLYDVSGNGLANVRTSVPFQGDLNVLAKQFAVDAEISSGQVMRAQRVTPVAGPPMLNTLLLSNGTPVPDTTASPGWGETPTFMRDVRNPSEVYQASDQGGGLFGIWPWRDAPASGIDRVCQQSTAAGVSNYRADALFQRPVVNPPGMTDPNAVVRLQFGRAIADSTPDFKFRLADAAQVPDASSPAWNVAATAVRRGAFYEIRPAEPLRQGRSYDLQVSTDGVKWDGDLVIRDAQNGVVNQGSSNLAVIYIDNLVVADTTYSELAVASATAPARLRGGVSVRDGQAVSRYQWTQISGVPLRLATPGAAETDVVLDASPQAVGDAVVQLTVTDALGRTDRVRVALKAGTFAAQGAVLFVESGNSLRVPHRDMTTGLGSFFYGPQPGRLSPRVVGASEGGTGTSFSITPANGLQLAVGVYGNAAHAEAAGTQNALLSRVFCNTDGAPVSGSFEVLDVAYAGDGSISRLAVDYVQRCEAGFNEYERGSYRYNSTIPVTP